MINNVLFYCNNKDTYPPFKNGLYLEEFILDKWKKGNFNTKKKFIPALWTNFQIEDWFERKKKEMQNALNEWVQNNPSKNGYIAICQYDDGPKLNLPKNTQILGCCSGDIPIPLIYQDITNRLVNYPKKKFSEKKIMCSFVGCLTSNGLEPDVRRIMNNKLSNNKLFNIYLSGGWTPKVNVNNQNNFIEIISNSKFCLAPRGYGRSSFRFFEIYKLGSIPIYLWNDKEWLPFREIIDYSKICISLNIKDIDKLEAIIKNITEKEYEKMYSDYLKVEHLFNLEGTTKYLELIY